jgi:hypothetical protein
MKPTVFILKVIKCKNTVNFRIRIYLYVTLSKLHKYTCLIFIYVKPLWNTRKCEAC